MRPTSRHCAACSGLVADLVALPVRLRALAAADVESVIAYYRREASDGTALDFVDALEHAVSQIRRSPRLGSLRFAYGLGIPELRVWTVEHFPYLVFYVPRDDQIDVWRILHSRRDFSDALSGDR